eukprot:gene19625-26309_t
MYSFEDIYPIWMCDKKEFIIIDDGSCCGSVETSKVSSELNAQIVEQDGCRNNHKLLEDVFEALLGAMFCDFNARAIKSDKLSGFGIGYQVVEQWLTNVFETHIQ